LANMANMPQTGKEDMSGRRERVGSRLATTDSQ
jgi:hypothetical protein